MKLKKILACLMAVALTTGCLAGCGGEKKKAVDNTVEDTTNLKIMLYAKGYGTEWLTKVAESFEAKYEGVKVDINLVNSADVMKADIKNTEYCDTDLYFDIVAAGGHGLVNELKQTYNNGQALRDMVRETLSHPRIKSRLKTLNEGQTRLLLRKK